jgi:hypothetical protein
MKAESEEAPRFKTCPICTSELPLSEFGVCRARKDGRNLYCKSCIRKKVTDSRRALKEYKSARKNYLNRPLLDPDGFPQTGDSSPLPHFVRAASKLSPVERVREVIKRGARTQKEIAQETKLGKDEIGDALANLLLWTREIRTEVVQGGRMYFLNESVEAVVFPEASPFPRRKSDVPSSFSALPGLMPGRNPEGETERIAGWVAA